MSTSRTKPARAILKDHGEGVPTQNTHIKMKSSKQNRKLKRANLEILSRLAYLIKSNKTILWGTGNESEVVISISKLSDSSIKS